MPKNIVPVDSWFAKLALEAVSVGADNSQEYALIEQQLSTVDDDTALLTITTVEEVLDYVTVPERNCRCHISPPCDDCVENAGTREYLDYLKRWLGEQP